MLEKRDVRDIYDIQEAGESEEISTESWEPILQIPLNYLSHFGNLFISRLFSLGFTEY